MPNDTGYYTLEMGCRAGMFTGYQGNIAIGYNAGYANGCLIDKEQIEERKKYPLFFWRKTCKKEKNGNT